MTQQLERLWQYYQETWFIVHQDAEETASFAIITAHNPKGQVLSEEQNGLLDQQLQQAMARRQERSRQIIGCSPDRRHQEKSWMVYTTRRRALVLAEQFQQNALYWVDNDELWLVPCLLQNYPAVRLGSFKQRLITLP